MQKRLVQIFAILVTGLAIAGLFVEDKHLFDLMNVDMALDVFRIALAAALLYAAFGNANAQTIRNVLAFLGISYIGLGVLGLIDSELWGLLPTGLTGFDIVFHLGAGLLATIAAFMPNSDRSATEA